MGYRYVWNDQSAALERMRTLTRRIDSLESLLGIAAGKPCSVWVVRLFDHELALNDDRCLEILRECGFLPNGRSFAVVHLCDIPDGLNAVELETFLRQNGAEFCGSGRHASVRRRAAAE
jgi:hypothetical protein